MYISSIKDAVLKIDLLKLTCFEDSHYVLIRSLSRLLARTKCKGQKYFFLSLLLTRVFVSKGIIQS